MSVPLRLAAALVAAAALAGCAETSHDAETWSLEALAAPTPAAVAAKPTPTPTPECGDPTASLRPTPPGQIPAGSTMDRIRKRGRLIAGVDQNTLLFAYLNPSTARIEGFEVDLLREVARAIFGDPGRLDLRAVTTDQRLPAVRSGKVDIVADAETITCLRRRSVAFSTVYYVAHQRLLVPAGSPARSLSDLGHKRVCATTTSTSLQRIATDRAHPILHLVPQRTDCLVDLQEGNVDAITSDDAILLGFHAQDPHTKLIGPPLEQEPYGMAIDRRHPDLVRFVNGVLERLRRDGTWSRIHRRWLGTAASPPAPHYR